MSRQNRDGFFFGLMQMLMIAKQYLAWMFRIAIENVSRNFIVACRLSGDECLKLDRNAQALIFIINNADNFNKPLDT